MGQDRLRAVIVGAGWAGEGHALALRQVDVDVVAICARQPEVVRDVARRLEIPEASTDWRSTILRVKPDIVTIATPAALRAEVIELAAATGCHILCEKPLATSAEEADRLAGIAEDAGVKHAFGLTHAVDPTVRWVGDLVRDGAIGTMRAFDVAFHLGPDFLNPLTAWSWADSAALGGGLLNNVAIHWLSVLETMAGCRLARVVGTAARGRERAPVVPGMHDFRVILEHPAGEDEAQHLEWRACDADWSFAALLTLNREGSTEGDVVSGPMTATTQFPPVWPPNGWRLYGDRGMLTVDNPFAPITVFRRRSIQDERETLPVPPELLEAAPHTGDDLVNMWTILAGDFVSDIRGEAHGPYPTFHDGRRLQAAIDAIRSGRGWTKIPDERT